MSDPGVFATGGISALPRRVPRRHRLAASLVAARLGRWSAAALSLRLPDGRTLELGNPAAGVRVSLVVDEWDFFWRALTAGDIGVGESFMEGQWHCSDLVELCRSFLLDQSCLDYRSFWTILDRLRNRLIRLWQTNTLTGSRRNIRHHYDLSNDFFRLFLDESMTYSCAVFPTPTASLAEAQREKIDRICRRLELRRGHE
ncbi:MAG: class I SAM-dependent methyltransferase, partial [Candidatus Binatia bacterium]